jgi:sirohydrochlorin ferrochelatase
MGPRTGEKSYGVLLLGEGGDLNWKSTVESIRQGLSAKGLPMEFAQGPADAKEIQKAVTLLESRGVKKIVVVPLCLSSYSDNMDENRYLFGIREKQPAAYLSALHSMGARAQERVKVKVPIAMTKALDDSQALVDILASRAKAQSREPASEALMLVGQAPTAKEGLQDWSSTVSALAEKVRQKAGFKRASSAALSENGNQRARNEAEAEVHKAVIDLHRQGTVIVVPLELSRGVVHIRLPRVLDGVFARYDGKPILPDPQIAKWVADSAEAGAKLPDMRLFKNSGGDFSTMTPAAPINFGSPLGATGGH